MDAERQGGGLVVGDRPHEDSLSGILEEEAEEDEKHDADERRCHIDRRDEDRAELTESPRAGTPGRCGDAAAEEEEQQALEDGGQPHGEHNDEDQRLTDERTQKDALHYKPEDKASRQGDEKGQIDGQSRPGGEHQEEKGAYGQELPCAKFRTSTT